MTDPTEAAHAVLDDLTADGDLDVTAWTDLDGLPADLDVLAGQAQAILAFARAWVCQRAGFEPSPVCLLRPLAELMDVLALGLTQVEELAVADWQQLRSAVVTTVDDLKAVDAAVADAMPVVA